MPETAPLALCPAGGRHLSAHHGEGRSRGQPDRTPRPDRGRGHRPAGLPTEEGGPEPAQVLAGGGPRLPAWAGTSPVQLGCERSEPDAELVLPPEALDGHGGGREHRLGVQEVTAVEPDVGQGGQALQCQGPPPIGMCVRCGGEPAAEPPVPRVQLRRGGFLRPGGQQCAGDGARHGRRGSSGGRDRRAPRGPGPAGGRARAGPLADGQPVAVSVHSGRRGCPLPPPTARPWGRARRRGRPSARAPPAPGRIEEPSHRPPGLGGRPRPARCPDRRAG